MSVERLLDLTATIHVKTAVGDIAASLSLDAGETVAEFADRVRQAILDTWPMTAAPLN